MTPLRIAAAIVPALELHRLYLAPGTTMRAAAAHLNETVRTSDPAHTLEWARPVMPAHRLEELDLIGGDRLLIVRQPPALFGTGALDGPLPGAGAVTVAGGGLAVQGGGKPRLILGKADPYRAFVPDIDLSPFIAPTQIDYLSRVCALLEFVPLAVGGGRWHMSKAGVTRVLLDDFEIGAEPIPVEGQHRLRLFRAADDPQRGENAFGEMVIRVEAAAGGKTPVFIPGERPTVIGVGRERVGGRINADPTVSAAELTAHAAAFHRVVLPPETDVYRLRLLSPNETLGGLALGGEDFLYYAAADGAPPSLLSTLTGEPRL
ncbi:MAG: hypothetical protein SF162_09025 [bacterium]|nr:hypothetical protein [bacterium]